MYMQMKIKYIQIIEYHCSRSSELTQSWQKTSILES